MISSASGTSNKQRLSFTTAIEEPVRAADAVFIAVGTPSHCDAVMGMRIFRTSMMRPGEIAATALDGFTGGHSLRSANPVPPSAPKAMR